jgi:hypothetical protein
MAQRRRPRPSRRPVALVGEIIEPRLVHIGGRTVRYHVHDRPAGLPVKDVTPRPERRPGR